VIPDDSDSNCSSVVPEEFQVCQLCQSSLSVSYTNSLTLFSSFGITMVVESNYLVLTHLVVC
jgi:hypothetical protein